MKNATIIHIPHASTEIPKQYIHSFCSVKLQQELNVMTDWFCDELFDCDRDKIVFPISRLVCDVERFRNDECEIMAKVGMGVIYTQSSDLGFLRSVTDIERNEILSLYYDVHHRAFTKAVEERLQTFGYCLIIDGHSFYHSVLPYEICKDEERPDFCIGMSDYHTQKKTVENLVLFLQKQGYSVKINSPFEGTIVPMKYYEKDRRVHSLMIEINRKLYMDKPGVKSEQFSEIHSVLEACIEIAEKSIDV